MGKYRRAAKQKASRKTSKRATRRQPGVEVPRQVQRLLDPQELVRMAQDSLHTFAVEMGLTIAGLLRAEEKFRRVTGFKHIAQLLAALDAELLDAKRETGRDELAWDRRFSTAAGTSSIRGSSSAWG